MSSNFLTIAQVAEELQVPVSTVRAWIARGQLNSCKIGRLVRVQHTDLEDLIVRRKAPNKNHPSAAKEKQSTEGIQRIQVRIISKEEAAEGKHRPLVLRYSDKNGRND